jgi:hypothetical protein
MSIEMPAAIEAAPSPILWTGSLMVVASPLLGANTTAVPSALPSTV